MKEGEGGGEREGRGKRGKGKEGGGERGGGKERGGEREGRGKRGEEGRDCTYNLYLTDLSSGQSSWGLVCEHGEHIEGQVHLIGVARQKGASHTIIARALVSHTCPRVLSRATGR